MLPQTLIIPCAGDAIRWQNHGGVPKYLAAPEGEPLLLRTLELFRTRAPDAWPYVVLRPGESHSELPADVAKVEQESRFAADVDKIAGSVACWSRTGRTLIVWGDVWLSEAAADAFCSPWPDSLQPDQVRWFGRPRASNLTGKPHPELWGLDFGPEAHAPLLRACGPAACFHDAAGWQVYSLLSFGSIGCHRLEHGAALHVVDDWTEDFDQPGDMHRWIDRRLAHFRATVPDRGRHP